MKKIISLVLALILSLSVASALAATKSPGTNDNYGTETESLVGRLILIPDSKLAAELLEILKGSASIDDFFGEVITVDGTKVLLSDLLGTDKLTVNEFVGVTYEGPMDKKIKVAITVPSVYKEGERVIVVIGIVEGEEVTWYGFEGTVNKKSQVIVELTPELFKAMKDKDCVIAIVSIAE